MIKKAAEAKARMRSSERALKVVLEYADVIITIAPGETSKVVTWDSALHALGLAANVIRRDLQRAGGAARLAARGGVAKEEAALTTDALFLQLNEVCKDGIRHGGVTVSRAREK